LLARDAARVLTALAAPDWSMGSAHADDVHMDIGFEIAAQPPSSLHNHDRYLGQFRHKLKVAARLIATEPRVGCGLIEPEPQTRPLSQLGG